MYAVVIFASIVSYNSIPEIVSWGNLGVESFGAESIFRYCRWEWHKLKLGLLYLWMYFKEMSFSAWFNEYLLIIDRKILSYMYLFLGHFKCFVRHQNSFSVLVEGLEMTINHKVLCKEHARTGKILKSSNTLLFFLRTSVTALTTWLELCAFGVHIINSRCPWNGHKFCINGMLANIEKSPNILWVFWKL